MRAVGEWMLVFILAASALGVNPGAAAASVTAPETAALQSSALQLTGPTACPPGGCAGGQRIGMRYDFDFGSATFDGSADPNVMVCFYTSRDWASASTSVMVDPNGEITQQEYRPTADGNCTDQATPTGYDLAAARVTTLAAGTPGDALRFAFRLGNAGSGTGRGIARLYVWTAGAWTPLSTASASSPTLTMISPPTADTVYVANDSGACGAYSPCYVNSDGDSTDGLGTGLKDAVDVVSESASINIIGSYTIKTSTVVINQKLTIAGVGDAQITYTGLNNATACSVGMLALDETVTIRGLNIDDGNCTVINRNLLEVNSATGRTGDEDIVFISSNDLTGGDNAIFVRGGNTDRVIVRFNHVSGNYGHAIFYEGSGDSALEVTANNITSNGTAINCAAAASAPIGSRKANHNYWGASAPSQDDTHCTIAAAKRLGAPIAHNSSTPGVRAQAVQVTGTKAYAPNFGNQIAYNHTGSGGGDFNLFIVDHGYMIASGPPFSGAQRGESPSPCSNYWDVFLADGEAVENNLELYFKYFNKDGETPGCLAVINSTQYCDQTSDQKKYPLFWLDPSADSVTTWWDQVGAPPQDRTDEDGQKTACHISSNEIQVTIDGNGRPNLNDLGYTPFMVGVPVIKSFKLYASSQSVRVEWITNNEPDISGFYVLRGTSASQLTPINGDLIAHSGKASSGYTYNLTDSGRANGTTYYYRLQVVRTDGNSFYSEVKSILVNAATATSPPPTRTWTPVLPTRTRTPTLVPSKKPTQNPSKTMTPAKSKSPTPTSIVLPTLTKTLNVLTPGVPETQTALAQTRAVEEPAKDQSKTPNGDVPGGGAIEASTAIAMVDTQTPSAGPTLTPAGAVAEVEAGSGANPWSSLLLGLLAGLIMIGGAGGWWYFYGRK